MKTQTKTLTSIMLPCPCCGAEEASICVQLASLDDEAFACNECEASFSVEFVRKLIGKWTKLLTWVESVPSFDE